ncbi:NUDIX domain-containing protein [Bacillus sp. JCM 19041]|uniref:NUDIX hydrolase n=1 Tax=Bacillus sp. JCM 19041 TaxID=1460637 RepID=UPI0006D22E56
MFIVNVEAAIYNEGNKWLVIKRSEKEEHAPGELSLVGGKVDATSGYAIDVLEKTVIREVWEEVGIRLQDQIDYVYSSFFTANDGVQVVDIVFLCEHASGQAIAKSKEEVDEVKWLASEYILSDVKAPDYLKEHIRRADKARESRK